MNKRSMLLVLILAVLALSVAVVIVYFNHQYNDYNLQGKLVFAKTFDAGSKVDKIVVTTAEDSVELVQRNSYWLIVNRGGYYADFQLMHRFLSSINKSIYSVKLPYKTETLQQGYLFDPRQEKQDSGMLIQTYAGQKLLDEVIVGLPNPDGRYFFARRPQDKAIWLVDGDFDLPVYSRHWLLRPVLSVSERGVESITSDGKHAQRDDSAGSFTDDQGRKADVAPLLNVLQAVYAVDVQPEAVFKEKYGDQLAEPKVIDVITFYGLEFICRLYTGLEGRVWLNVNLSTTPLPISSVNDYIRDNRFLYDGWYFEISPEQRHVLRNFRLM